MNQVKLYLVETFNINHFDHLRKKYELWDKIPGSFEYRSFCNLVNKEYEYTLKMTEKLKLACEK